MRLIVALVTLLAASPAHALDLPLAVHELLPLVSSGKGAGLVPGRARLAEPVTAGIPLSEADGVTDVSTLSVVDDQGRPVPAQFRALNGRVARHPTGEVKWALVDFQSDLPAGTTRTYRLTTGTASTLPALASETPTAVTVNTGVQQFTLRRKGFNLFESVGGVAVTPAPIPGCPCPPLPGPGSLALVKAGGPGVVVRAGSVEYTSANDPDSVVTIEENGPLRAVVKAEGALKSAAGARLMDYTARLHFSRGRHDVRVFVTLRHAKMHASEPAPFVSFDSAEVVVPLAVASSGPTPSPSLTAQSLTATFGKQGAPAISRPLAATDRATLFQGHSTAWSAVFACGALRTSPMERTCVKKDTTPGVYTQQGLEIRHNDTVLHAFGSTADHAEGWVSLRSADGAGLTVALRWMAGYWPSGFEMSGDGRVSVELFSKRNPKKNLLFTWGVHEERELLFDFTPNGSGQAALYRLQYPLIARAPFAQYAAAGAFLGERTLATLEEHQAWALATRPLLASPYPATTPDSPMKVERYYRWESPNEQHDHELSQLAEFYRTGFSGLYLRASGRSRYKATNAIIRSDGFDLATVRPGGGTWGNTWSPRFRAPNDGINGMAFDHAHPHWLSIPLAYYLTGDESLREATIDFGEMRAADVQPQAWKHVNRLSGLGPRPWIRVWRDFALMWEFDPRPIYLEVVRTMTDLILNSVEDGAVGTGGWSLSRGWWNHGHDGKEWVDRQDSQNIYSRIRPEAMWEVLRVIRTWGLAWRPGLADDLADRLEGHGRFTYGEPYFQVSAIPKQGEFGYWAGSKIGGNNYHYDVANTLAQLPEFSPQDSCAIMRALYETTGDERYLIHGSKMLYASTQGESDQPGAPQCMALVARAVRRDAGGTARVPVTVTATAGAHRLEWVAPKGAASYRVKCADRPIVDWHGFDQLTRVYQYPPEQHAAFWSAKNVEGEPDPSDEGTPETMTVAGLGAGPMHCAVRYERKAP